MMKKLAITKQTEQEFAYVDSIIAAHSNSAVANCTIAGFATATRFVPYHVHQSCGDYQPLRQFYHRALQCLVAIELKSVDFEAEFVSKLDLYLEALDRDYKRPNENPSVGIILCPSADKSEVEYTLSRSLSPTMVAEYRRLLVPVDVMQRSLAEYCEYLKKEFSNTSKTEDR
ncbi:MAG: DUF1016 family protein [Bacteroidales bacterium]|nr:DUF1016 family protein [Bacteroidales bacterium]